MADAKTEMRRWHDWTDPDYFAYGRQRDAGLVRLFLRQIISRQLQRTRLTLSGWILIVVALGIGSAAYTTTSNILFMTLSLLLSGLVLSGILSQINFRKLTWSLRSPQHLQVGEVGMAEVVLINGKRFFPSMCIAFLAGDSAAVGQRRLRLQLALPAGKSTRLEWTFEPRRRGQFELTLHGLESKFPFGFIQKAVGTSEGMSVLVWPARCEYTFAATNGGLKFVSGASRSRAGLGSDLLNIRRYERGDPPRLIHWKASARMNHLMTRQMALEGEQGYEIHFDPQPEEWTEHGFEQLCSTACALAEDLFHAGRLDACRVAGEERIAARSLLDLHAFFDQIARADLPSEQQRTNDGRRTSRSLITFKPREGGGVLIYVDGTQSGQA